MAKRKIMGVKECDKHLENLEFKPVLESRVRQVRWLYNNANKCLMVYEEKLVRVMIHKLEEKVTNLKKGVEDIEKYLDHDVWCDMIKHIGTIQGCKCNCGLQEKITQLKNL